MYYADKIASLQDLFGTTDVRLEPDALWVGSRRFPIKDDVIILSQDAPQAEDIQFSFGSEWKTYDAVRPDHRPIFDSYFDLIDLTALSSSRVVDLGCGMGRWSYFMKDYCRELVLVDFSEAIFVARKNLAGARNALFFMGDIQRLPFRDNFADLVFSLGVLHHLPTPCLDVIRQLRQAAPRLLIYLYYALDNRPAHYRWLLRGVSALRAVLSRTRGPAMRKAFSVAATWLVYLPLIQFGRALQTIGVGSQVPLFDYYQDKTRAQIEQDVYDRFFTRIEQRVSREDIRTLSDAFSKLTISDKMPYWHFLCER
jgi:SAM-dependent methyltransferase